MRAIHYAKALHELTRSEDTDPALFSRFVEILAKNGHLHLARKMVRILTRLIEREAKQNTIELTSAQPLTEGAVGELLKRDPWKHAVTAQHKRVVRTTDDTLTLGVVLRTSKERVDASAKRSLLDLYQSLISN